MRPSVRAGIALAVAVAILSLAGLTAALGDGAGPDTPVSSTPRPDDPVGPGPRAQTVVPTSGMANVHPTAWTKAVVGSDDRTITVRFWSGVEPCYVLDRVDVSYRTDAVTITLYQGNDPTAGAGAVCPDIALLKQTVVALDQPLAGRQIVDGSQTA